jgi:hypothetical protein
MQMSVIKYINITQINTKGKCEGHFNIYLPLPCEIMNYKLELLNNISCYLR